MKFYFLCILLSLSFSSEANDKIIYGEDNRHDIYTYQDQSIVELSRSTVALVRKSDIRWDGKFYNIPFQSLEAKMSLCTQERFFNQPTAAFCSGFLIAPNKIMTAGHCIENLDDCEKTAFIFDYRMANKDQYFGKFPNIYLCKKVLGQSKNNNGVDFAIIEIDEEVPDRTPLTLSTNTEIAVNDPVFTIGHPSGLPAKITDNGHIRNIKYNEGYFVTNLDTYGGNSGSAVFNARTHEVEGILVRGDTDYLTINNKCRSSNRVGNQEGKGESVTLITQTHQDGIYGDESSIANDDTFRYIWFAWFNTCNEFRGSVFRREVAASYCRR